MAKKNTRDCGLDTEEEVTVTIFGKTISMKQFERTHKEYAEGLAWKALNRKEGTDEDKSGK